MQHIGMLFLCVTLIGAKGAFAYTCDTDSVISEDLSAGVQGLRNPHYDIVAARIAEIKTEGGATNGQPPTVLLRVSEVLRGHIEPGIYAATWQGALRNTDNIDPGDYTFGIKPEWYECLLSTPPVGTDIIAYVLLADDGTNLFVKETNVFRDTNNNRSVVSRNAAPAERQRSTQRLLLLALVSFPVVGLALIFTTMKGVGAFLSFSVLPLYGFYESGFSVYSNIRIDLLIVWPALALANLIIYVARTPIGKVVDGDENES